MNVQRQERLGLCWLGSLTQQEANKIWREPVYNYTLLMAARTAEYNVDIAVKMIVARELERIRRSSKEK